ncbi:uncharacterized protein LOC128090631 isoform X3 [Tympanuchus pallidicinctus]|uniref:uncharacterized protein LOC128090631 isoform X3 n=1 Tax=Tympanuchus pallidicinctus TaxID=109042 RepID=UPI002286F7BC|nr:uncharacterized protein LOC128090631 isoform X3 [Tympanuchus pallidicinctus]
MFPALCLIMSHCLIPIPDGIYGVSGPALTYFLCSASWAPLLLVLSLCLSFSIGDPFSMHSLCLSFPTEDPLSMHCLYGSVSPFFAPSLCTLYLSFPMVDPFSMHCSHASVSPLRTPFPLRTPSPCTAPVPQFPHGRPPLCTLFLCLSFPTGDPLSMLYPLSAHSSYASVSPLRTPFPLRTPSPCTAPVPQFPHGRPPLCTLFLCLSFPTGDPLSMLYPLSAHSSYASVSPLRTPFPLRTPSPCTAPVPQFPHSGPPLCTLFLCLSFPTGDPLSMLCPYASVSSLGTPSPSTIPVPQFPHGRPLLCTLFLCLTFYTGDPPLSAHFPRASVSPSRCQQAYGAMSTPPALLPLSPVAQASPRW